MISDEDDDYGYNHNRLIHRDEDDDTDRIPLAVGIRKLQNLLKSTLFLLTTLIAQ